MATIDLAAIAGIALWALALAWGFSPISNRAIERVKIILLGLRPSGQRMVRDDSETDPGSPYLEVLASLLAIIPFLLIGSLTYYGISSALGRSWAVSWGVIAAMGCGIYELGRQDSQDSQ